MNIEELLNKYFEGETSAQEERMLRSFFSKADVPEGLAVYKPLFAYFDQEIARKETEPELASVIPMPKEKKRYYWFSVAAACLFVMLLAGKYFFPANNGLPCSGNYVIINGQCYSDPDKVRSMALVSLQEVATTPDEYKHTMDVFSDKELIDNQLKELGSLLGDEE